MDDSLPDGELANEVAGGRSNGQRNPGRAFAQLLQRCVAKFGGSNTTRAELLTRVNALRDQEPALQAHSESVEEGFMQAGRALREQAELTSRLVQHGRQFDSFTADSSENNPVRAAISLIERSLDEFEQFQRESGILVERLRVQHEEITQLKKSGAQLERAIAPLRIVDTLLRIEAASLPAELQAAFSALTQEIGHLDARVRDAFVRNFDALGATRDTIAKVLQQLSAEREQHERLANDERSAIRSSLVAFEAEMGRIRRQNERSGQAVAEIDREAGAVVVALQFQDITRQKLEHVRSALAALPERAAQGPTGAAVAFSEHATRLQALQLAAVEHDLQSAVTAIEVGLRNMVHRLQHLETEVSDESNGFSEETSAPAIIDGLFEMLAQLRNSMEEVSANARIASDAVKSFGGVTADLGETIRELTWGIRLIALNAQVQAAQVARCDGLEVLARHTYVVSQETSHFGDAVGRDLAAVTGRLQSLVTQADESSLRAGRSREHLNRESERIFTMLREQRETVSTALRDFPALLRHTREHATRLLDRADLAHVDRVPLRALKAQLQEVSAWCAARHSEEDAKVVRAEFAALEGQYTMKSERAVHDAAFSASASQGPVAAVGTDSTVTGNNVELF